MSADDRDPTWGVQRLSGANFQAFEDVVDRLAAQRGVDRRALRNALGHWVDHDLDTAVGEYDVPKEIVREAAAACSRAVQQQYPELS